MAFNIDEEMSHFPCSFNLQTGRKISLERFRHARDKEMKELELKGSTIEEKIASEDLSSLELYGSILEEKIRGLNLLTWLLHKLEHVKEAEILNKKILQKTGNNNLTALGNRVFILFDHGDILAAIKHCEELLQLTEKAESFEQIKYNALAEQAYSFSKLGGIENYKLSIQLYTECISKYPENYLWKYGLGMIYRRVTNYDLQFSNKDKLNVADITVKCQDLLNEVARNGDYRLRGHAYAQLAQLLHQDVCAHASEITKLVNEALKYGRNSSTVLTYCGMSVKKINTDQAIELLRASLQIKEIAMTYHHLGLSLLIKAESIKNNANSPTESLNHNKLNFEGISEPFDRGSLCRVESLKEFVQSPCTTLDKENALVREAIQCFEKSLEVSHGENIPAKFDLAETHFKLNEFDTALKHYNIMTRMLSSDYLVRKISAHEGAGRCLKELSKLPDKSDKLKNLAEDEFKKALSLAADLASKNPEYAGCETKVWQAFTRLMDDAEELSSPDVKQKSTLKYLELAKNKDFERTIKQLLKEGLLQDFEMLRKGLDRLLEKGDYESALTFLSMASTRSVFTTNVSWSSEEFEALRSRTYTLTAWDRLQKGSADSRRVFQQVFQLKYKQCIGIFSESEKDDQSDDQTSVSDVLIVNDDSADSEDAPDVTTSIAVTLRQVLKIVFGLEVTRNIERANNEHMKLELQLQEMKRYNVVVLLLGNNDAPDYNEMMKAVHAVGISRVLALSTRPLENVPIILREYQCIDLTKTEWKLTNQSPVSCGEDVCGFSEKDSRTEIIMKCFNGINEEVIKLFCSLVNEDFTRYKPNFKTTEERIQVCP